MNGTPKQTVVFQREQKHLLLTREGPSVSCRGESRCSTSQRSFLQTDLNNHDGTLFKKKTMHRRSKLSQIVSEQARGGHVNELHLRAVSRDAVTRTDLWRKWAELRANTER